MADFPITTAPDSQSMELDYPIHSIKLADGTESARAKTAKKIYKWSATYTFTSHTNEVF